MKLRKAVIQKCEEIRKQNILKRLNEHSVTNKNMFITSV